MIVQGDNKNRSVGDPCPSYESLADSWRNNRAMFQGERSVKEMDEKVSYKNILIPFSSCMTLEQYRIYKAEAELPNAASQFCRMVIAGLLKKTPAVTSESDLSDLLGDFGVDGSCFGTFLEKLLNEEMPTNRSWIQVDFGERPTATVLPAESVINWGTRVVNGKETLDLVVIRKSEFDRDPTTRHTSMQEIVEVHELDEEGLYVIYTYVLNSASVMEYVEGRQQQDIKVEGPSWELRSVNESFLVQGERLRMVPIWPTNGNIDPIQPFMSPVFDKERHLYNKVSRRNHLLYNAASFTPIVFSDLAEEKVAAAVDRGLGSWLHFTAADRVETLKTPTDALKDMNETIQGGYSELAQQGARLLAAEGAESGVAITIRNTGSMSLISSLSKSVSSTLSQVVAFMHFMSTGKQEKVSVDLSRLDMGELSVEWSKLVSDWYREGLLPRSVWLHLVKRTGLLPDNYNDEEGKQELENDSFRRP